MVALRSDVAGRAGGVGGEELFSGGGLFLGEAEVHDHGAQGAGAILRQEDVVGFEVAVEEAAVVGGLESGADLQRDGESLLRGRGAVAAQPGGERQAVDVLHGEEIDDTAGRLGGVHLEDAADVGMSDAEGAARLGRQVHAVAGLGALEGAALVEALVLGQVDDAHAAFGNLAENAEAAGHEVADGEGAGAGFGLGRGGGEGFAGLRWRRGSGRVGQLVCLVVPLLHGGIPSVLAPQRTLRAWMARMRFPEMYVILH